METLNVSLGYRKLHLLPKLLDWAAVFLFCKTSFFSEEGTLVEDQDHRAYRKGFPWVKYLRRTEPKPASRTAAFKQGTRSGRAKLFHE